MKIPSVPTLKRVMQRSLAEKKHAKCQKRHGIYHIIPVFNKNKSEKFRMVFDAAAEYNGNRLNKALLTGPDLLNNLVGVMLWFHNYRVVFSSDIEGMYHQVQVNLDDADALRFLWLEDVNSDEKPDTYQIFVHIFGGKDSPSCANYAVTRTASDHGSKFDAAVIECVNRSFYIDELKNKQYQS